jgi:hypothetical protein
VIRERHWDREKYAGLDYVNYIFPLSIFVASA